ncbi:16S rRNA (guanine(527)-N(7))-methyltransferase RsmG [Holophaga foetida]|uniref:16S rRNA (guanine(527)-N(7))-methyltransferase RsmG n=1 Tax=Holophaga foetida TaxID=35839 RepID=UPI00130E62B3|nr:RsmG family class I SAM-dependent methyltransferase [Holophaga foetida]
MFPPTDPRLDQYLALLDRWNRTHALTALPPEVRFEELVLDSAALLPHLAHLPPGALVADFGTGMGIPATVIAICRPDLRVAAIDKVGKKMAFVRQAVLELGLDNLKPCPGLAENLPPLQAQAGVAKAVGTLELLMGWWGRHSAPSAPFFAMKGPDWAAEPKPKGWTCVAHPYRLPTRGERVVIELRPDING